MPVNLLKFAISIHASPLQIFTRLSLFFCLIISSIPNLGASQLNGFTVEASSLIAASDIHHGGPPKDGIPAIDHPHFIQASAANYLKHGDRVLGLYFNNIAKAYPLRILNWHEIVNDDDILVSYCPLCGTGMAFNIKNADFGVSGLLYNSDMLLYDRQTESLWAQIPAKAISGKRKGELLNMLAVENTSWANWRQHHPNTLVLSDNTGFNRDYSKSPYGNYTSNKALYFPLKHTSRRYHPKEPVIGIELNGIFKAYPFEELRKSQDTFITDSIGGTQIEIYFDKQHHSGRIKLDSGDVLPSLTSYWFAWYAFHPQTEIYTHRK